MAKAPAVEEMEMAQEALGMITSLVAKTALSLRQQESFLVKQEAALVVTGSHALALYDEIFERLLKEIDR